MLSQNALNPRTIPVPTMALVATLVALTGCGADRPSAEATTPAAEIATDVAGAPADATTTGWTLDPEASRIAFMSIKGGEIAEVHTFRTISGTVGADGAAEISVNLDSVETNVEIRNTRMREMLFHTDVHPTATARTNIDLAALKALPVGGRMELALPFRLDFHGVEADVTADMFVTRVGAGKVLVESAGPLIVEASAYGLEAGVDALREVAGLPSIAPLAPVTVSLVFDADGRG